jgi:hypothetical protein
MSVPQLSLSVWQSVLLGLALELGVVAAGMLFVSAWAKRPWRERLLALVPVAAFVWVVLLARGVRAQAEYWAHYLAFQAAHYAPQAYPDLARQTQRDYGLVVEGANRLGWTAVLAAEGVALLGGALALRWWRARRHPRQGPLTLARAAGEAGEPDITVEPLSRRRGG